MKRSMAAAVILALISTIVLAVEPPTKIEVNARKRVAKSVTSEVKDPATGKTSIVLMTDR